MVDRDEILKGGQISSKFWVQIDEALARIRKTTANQQDKINKSVYLTPFNFLIDILLLDFFLWY